MNLFPNRQDNGTATIDARLISYRQASGIQKVPEIITVSSLWPETRANEGEGKLFVLSGQKKAIDRGVSLRDNTNYVIVLLSKG